MNGGGGPPAQWLMLEGEQLDDAVLVRRCFGGRRIRVLVFLVVLHQQCFDVARYPKSRVAHLAGVAEERAAEVNSVRRRNVPGKLGEHFAKRARLIY